VEGKTKTGNAVPYAVLLIAFFIAAIVSPNSTCWLAMAAVEWL
jgi:hypothetical protein